MATKTESGIDNVERELRLFACDCAERALLRERDRGHEPDERSWHALAVARRYADGEATEQELASACGAAWDAWASARDAACAAARAAWDAARDAAWAAWAAACASSWDAAWGAEIYCNFRWTGPIDKQ